MASPEHRPVRRFSWRQRFHLVADPGDWPVVVGVHVAGVVMTAGLLLKWIPAEQLAPIAGQFLVFDTPCGW